MEDSPDVVAAEFVESLQTMSPEEKRDALKALVDSLDSEEKSILEDALNILL